MAKGLNRHPGKAKLSFIFSEISRKPRPQGNGSDLSSISTGPATLGFFWIGNVSFVSERRSGLCTISEEFDAEWQGSFRIPRIYRGNDLRQRRDIPCDTGHKGSSCKSKRRCRDDLDESHGEHRDQSPR